jgi:SpoVK/Ycf46/Vps4 family AAA+-type ATPase
MSKNAHEKLSQLWYEMKAEGNCIKYVDEMISQLETLGTETNTLTKETIKTKLLTLIDKLV